MYVWCNIEVRSRDHCCRGRAISFTHSQCVSLPLIFQQALRMHHIMLPSVACPAVECKRNVMAHSQKPDSVFQRNGRVHLYRRGCQFSRVLAFLECGLGENDCSNTGWTVPSQAEDCWLPTPFASFPFTSPPVRRRVPPDSVCTLPNFPTLSHVRNGFLGVVGWGGGDRYVIIMIFSTTFVWNIYCSEKNSKRCHHKCMSVCM